LPGPDLDIRYKAPVKQLRCFFAQVHAAEGDVGGVWQGRRVDYPRRALIAVPMNSELRPVVKLSRADRRQTDGHTVYAARVGSVDLVIVRIGVGPASARRAAEWALAHFDVDHVVVCGIAGGLALDLSVGSVVVPQTVIDVESGKRYRSAPMKGVERRGLVATADHLILDEGRLAELEALGVLALEMESSGVAAACEAAGVRWTTFRVISDRPDQHLIDATMMSLLRPDGTADVAAALRLLVTQPRRIPAMIRLGRDSSRAAAKAARTALTALGWRAG
jgi:nucleoside phosphorylase